MRLANAPHVDTCQSAEEVIAKAREAAARRRRQLSPAPIKVIYTAPVQISEPTALPSLDGYQANISGHFLPLMRSDADVHIDPIFPTIRQVQKILCELSGFPMNEILSPRKIKPLTDVRQLGMALCRILTKRSFPEIGRRFGDRDHSTVIHSMRKMQPVIDEVKALVGVVSIAEIVAKALEARERIQPKTIYK